MYRAQRQSSLASYDENAAIAILQHLDKAALQKMLDNDEELENYIKSLDQVNSWEAEKKTLIASNKSCAEYNLGKEPLLNERKVQLASTYENAVEIEKQFQQHKNKLDHLASQQSMDTSLALLQTEAAKSEEETEDIAENFLDGKVEVEDFIETYVPKRILAHLRKVKAEKMAELLASKQQGRSGVSQGAFANRNPPYPSRPAPYPIGAASMPDPSSYLLR